MVVFIIGLSAGVVVMSLPEQADRFDEEAARLEQAVDGLSKRAVLTETVHSLEFTPDSYVASYWQDGEWVVLPRWEHDLPEGLRLDFFDRDRRGAPQRVAFHPSGIPAEANISLLGSGGRRMELSFASNRVEGIR